MPFRFSVEDKLDIMIGRVVEKSSFSETLSDIKKPFARDCDFESDFTSITPADIGRK